MIRLNNLSMKDILSLLFDVQEALRSMPKEKFEQHKTALSVERTVKPKTLSEECHKYWKELQCSEYHFNRGEFGGGGVGGQW